MKDKEILRLLQSNPAEGLREAISQYGGLVRLVISRILAGKTQDIEECTADAFIAVWQHAGNIQGDSLKGYLLCSARNLAINRYHQLNRCHFVLLDENDPASDEDIAIEVAWQEQAGVLHELISRLSEPDREIVLRKYFLFERISEIAAHFKMDESQIKGRLYRVRQRLKKALYERGMCHDAV